MSVSDRIEELYSTFHSFPIKSPIVRMGIKDDAFVLVAFEILLQDYHRVKKLNYENENHRELLTQFIVPPPDDSIDIFYEETDLDETKYHVIQVKNSALAPGEITTCFIQMEHTIKTFLKKPKDLLKNVREVILHTEFSQQFKNEITYYVVHKGSTNYIRGQKPNQVIITTEELEILQKGSQQMVVPKQVFEIDTVNNFIINNFIEEQNVQIKNNNLPQSLLCNFNGLDLAKLNNKYGNTFLGKNILYGQNLRESLKKNSRTFDKMFETIDREPELFLFYNNGITILSSFFDTIKNGVKDVITMENFSIINGAQTTSTLGAYLRKAEMDGEPEKIENLKKVFVLTKIYQINKNLKNHEAISENIKIYTNTQTPLSSRDMVSTRKEQLLLQERFFEGELPNIYINIKKGVDCPSYPKTYPHQQISNETLAQLVLCGFFKQPFTAKDKKTKIFDIEGKEGFTLNVVYHKIFDEKDGILFKTSKVELDELLFIYKLHEDTKKVQKFFLKDQITNISQHTAKDHYDKENKEEQISRIKRNMEISNVCLFYNIANYYIIKSNFDNYIPHHNQLVFDYKKYYNDKDFKKSVITSFLNIFFNKTIEIIRKNSNNENVNNWLRAEKNEKTFINLLKELVMDEGITIKEKYSEFVNLSKTKMEVY